MCIQLFQRFKHVQYGLGANIQFSRFDSGMLVFTLRYGVQTVLDLNASRSTVA